MMTMMHQPVVSNTSVSHHMHTAKASQKQNRLGSPLSTAFNQSNQFRGTVKNNNPGLDYSHTIDVAGGVQKKKQGGQMMMFRGDGLGKGYSQEEKDESDLGDLDEEEDESRTLFH